MKKSLIYLFLLVLILSLFFNQQDALGHLEINPQPTTNTPTTPLKELADSYAISLDRTETEIIINNCQTIIERDIFNLSAQLKANSKQYEELSSLTLKSLNFIENNLIQIAKDTTAINSLQQNLIQSSTSFSNSVKQYDLSLSRLLALADDCQQEPMAFIAGLKNIHKHRQLVLSQASEFLIFIKTSLKETLTQIKSDLED